MKEVNDADLKGMLDRKYPEHKSHSKTRYQKFCDEDAVACSCGQRLFITGKELVMGCYQEKP